MKQNGTVWTPAGSFEITGPIVIAARGTGKRLLSGFARLGETFADAAKETRAFGDALNRAAEIPVTLHWTRYGRLKARQLMGERLRRRERKYIWQTEHRAKTKVETEFDRLLSGGCDCGKEHP